ncbi:hypothetical protein C3375_07450 [Citrobacter freundii complex sp. CFNIH12]|nr:hypothetical protein CUC51_04485 [Citrobacter freundii]POU46678.1 hypothetical protein C3375_07450 [Citrobacter freundii complex sp. CFNIH12]
MVVLVGLAIDQIAQSGLSSLSVIYYSAQLFSCAGIGWRIVFPYIRNRWNIYSKTTYRKCHR